MENKHAFPVIHSFDASLAYVPKVEQTKPNTGFTSSHRQTTWRFNYNCSY